MTKHIRYTIDITLTTDLEPDKDNPWLARQKESARLLPKLVEDLMQDVKLTSVGNKSGFVMCDLIYYRKEANIDQ